MTKFLSLGMVGAKTHLVLAHGAGALMTSPFMEAISGHIASLGIRVHRFEFDYMAARRQGGARRPPPKVEVLMGAYADAVEKIVELERPQCLVIGGKSLGGRVASLVAQDLFLERRISGLVCLGYPFHPPGKPEKLRTAHLATLRCPALIVQGTRDPFGTRDEVERYEMSSAVTVRWIEGGGHDLNPPARSGLSVDQSLAIAAGAVLEFAEKL